MDSFQGEVVQLWQLRRGCVRTNEGSSLCHRNHESPSSHSRQSGQGCQQQRIYGWLRGEDSDLTEINRAVETTFSFRFCPFSCHLMKPALEKPGSWVARRVGAKAGPAGARQGTHRRDACCPRMRPTNTSHTSAATPALAPFQRGPRSSCRDCPLHGQVDNGGAWGWGLETRAGTEPGLGSPPSAHKATGGGRWVLAWEGD